ncbi:hypothetical protein JOL79_09235 [Microbispora sp. RL4-1S]|uniref:Uncharacterized protein n=1 Tax=Microbispora oryzae TaxID=2806554 RepID=A0A940WNL2_9ACTN|nr:hypothetical protein [Microbispora oryzae]MBP2703989.1 hypothetical protein [Microbispora oryzae]
MRISKFVVRAGLGTALALGAMTVPAQAAVQTSGAVFCGLSEWQDENTYGAACTATSSSYYAQVLCSNRQFAKGNVVSGGRWSYAYCTKFGSNVHIAAGEYGSIHFT